jgi:hypothetical protein
MPHYYFNLRNGLGLLEDKEGRELADLEAARAEGLKGARSLIAEEVTEGRLDLSGRIEIVDGDGRLLLAIPFGEAVAITRSGDDQSAAESEMIATASEKGRR